MTSSKKDPVLVILQLTGGNDYLNTLIPYNDPLYRGQQARGWGPAKTRSYLWTTSWGFIPAWGPSRTCGTKGRWPSSTAWAMRTPPGLTSAPWTSGTPASPTRWAPRDGWGGPPGTWTPTKRNVLTSVNFGNGLPRALALPGVSVASVSDLTSYGILTGLEDNQREVALERFRADVRAGGGHRVRDGLPEPDGPGRPEGCGHPQHRPGEVLLHGGVRGHLGGCEDAGYRPGAPGGLRHQSLLHPVRELRHPCQPARGARPAVEGCLGSRNRLLRGP